MQSPTRPARNSAALAAPFVLLALVASLHVCGTDYYVATTGNDSNPGTLSQPWASINHGVDRYNPGDTLYVRAGVYAPANGIYFYRSGSASAPITFRAYPGETAVLDGSNMPTQTMLVDIECNYFVMQDFEIRNSKWNGISNYGASNTILRNCNVHDCLYGGISVGKSDLTTTHDVLVDGCTVYNNCHMNDAHTLNSGWPGALTIGGATSVTVQNCTVYKNQGEGIIFYLADKCHSIGNVAHDNYGPNMYIDNATNCSVERNLLYSTGDTTYFRGGTPCPAIQMANEQYNISNPSNGITIVNNIMVNNNYAFYYGNYGNGGGLKNFTLANNSIYLARHGIFHVDADAHVNATFCNNISYQTTGGTQAELPASLTGLTFTHNLWYGGNVGAAWSSTDQYADPLFVNAGSTTAADYKLQSGSPAHAAGMALASITLDFFGATRPQPLDVGAAVYDASTPPPQTPPAPPAPPATPPPANTPPSFTSAPTYSPNPALTGQSVSFTAVAGDAENNTLVYTWNMGDGTTLTGSTVTTTYTNPGTYSVSVVVSDGTNSVTQTLGAVVHVPSDPPVVTPPPASLPPETPTFDVSSMAMTFNLSKINADTLSITGTVPLPAGFQPNGSNAVISIGNFQHAVTLNTRGVSRDRTFKLAGKMKHGTYVTTRATFVLSIRRTDLFSQMQGLGLSNLNGRHTQTINLGMTLGSNVYTSTASASYGVLGGK